MAQKICQAFGQGSISTRTTQRWFRKFSSGDESLKDEPREGRPYVINNDELQAAIEEDSTQTCQILAQKFSISDETVHLHLHSLGKVYKLSKWIPHQLTPANIVRMVDHKWICSL
ncbi:histone-lysine N-methyltransferase SETMAR-like [Centruroides sculpturatus]|uniref:histone-lysine N-methyltransferase SETMAR-like n=1 Tax=Centruroides sculpturatus TaxID=218467 RepID=UPI000C6DCB01|nr:histone-lysine N-methyltransferase SETMAR-like [Centruroides sculpturatus]